MKQKKPLPDQDETFSRLSLQLEGHLSDPHLTVGKLIGYIGMSRTSLHRKLKKETGMSTTEYIRHSRLNKARAFLVRYPGLPVSSIALKVGFFSRSYFSRQFKKEFGCSPREWRLRERVK